MTNGEEPETMPDSDDEVADYDGPDLILQALVATVNTSDDPDVFTSLTVTVPGAVVTGDAVPVWRWFEMVSAEIHDRYSESDTNLFTGLAEHMKDDPNRGEMSRVGFLHLANAHYVMASGIVPTSGSLLWRGRISEVSGWNLGSLTT